MIKGLENTDTEFAHTSQKYEMIRHASANPGMRVARTRQIFFEGFKTDIAVRVCS